MFAVDSGATGAASPGFADGAGTAVGGGGVGSAAVKAVNTGSKVANGSDEVTAAVLSGPTNGTGTAVGGGGVGTDPVGGVGSDTADGNCPDEATTAERPLCSTDEDGTAGTSGRVSAAGAAPAFVKAVVPRIRLVKSVLLPFFLLLLGGGMLSSGSRNENSLSRNAVASSTIRKPWYQTKS